MSQQEMDYGEMNRERPQFSYAGGYEGGSYGNNASSGSYGQKLSGSARGSAATAGQRLALAIVSIVMLVIMPFTLIGVAMAAHAPDWAVFPILFVIALFYAAVVIINIVFHRK